MNGIPTFLWFDDCAQEAAEFYVSVFPDSRLTDGDVFDDPRPDGPGRVTLVTFELAGRPFTALNGGPNFKFNEAISFQVMCDTQEEVDAFWDKLSAGGAKSRCGWLQDRYGLSWQIIPRILPQLLRDPNPAKAQAALEAMLQMDKLDIARLQQACDRA